MARDVRLTATGPMKVEVGSLPADKPTFLCLCGLSQKFPFCDGSHKLSREEKPGMVYRYSADAKTVLECKPDDTAPTQAGA